VKLFVAVSSNLRSDCTQHDLGGSREEESYPVG